MAGEASADHNRTQEIDFAIGHAMLELLKSSSWRAKVITLLAIAACCVTMLTAGTEPNIEANIEQLKARLSSASIGDRPHLCLQIAQQQLVLTDRQFAAGVHEKARGSVGRAVPFAQHALGPSIPSPQPPKHTRRCAPTPPPQCGAL